LQKAKVRSLQAKACHGHAVKPDVGDDVPQLRILPVAQHPHLHNGKDQLEGQDYRSFAEKAKKMNPGVTSTKERMDGAFRVAVSRAGPKRDLKRLATYVERMLIRVCVASPPPAIDPVRCQ
jgi:hypothetical protein